MRDHLIETIEVLEEELTGTVSSPASSHLMFAKNKTKTLDAERME